MSKRSNENIAITDDGLTVKKNKLCVTDQIVTMKREFIKGSMRMDNRVIYKLDCKTLHKKEQNLIYVETKDMFDKIEKDSSYKFTIERHDNGRWYLKEFEKLNDVVVSLKEFLTQADFEGETETLINFYVEGAYESNDCELIRIFGFVNFDNTMNQCELFVRLDQESCFKFNPEASRREKSKQALTEIIKNYVNKWCVFHVLCRVNYNKKFNLIIKNNTCVKVNDIQMEKPSIDNLVSCSSDKIYNMVEIKQVCKCELVENGTVDRIAFEFKLNNESYLKGSKFNIKKEDAEDIVSDIQSINFDIDSGEYIFYCVYSYKSNVDNPFMNIASVMSFSNEEGVNVVMSG
uniref:Late expression factor 3 n=1 Tax=Adoxophyes orana granulovirus TaxID=170617 RepID=A0A0A7V0R5_GVAO|nr:late expression factor 3 [Adoxophyes orana granulovirus]